MEWYTSRKGYFSKTSSNIKWRILGILPEITQEKLEEIVDQVIAQHDSNNLENKDLDELNELEDDNLEDDRILEYGLRVKY